jgi:hypothetical protein
MCDAALDRDMYDHSTESGNWVTPHGTVDPVRSDPRWPSAMRKHNGDEVKAFNELTKSDAPSVRGYARSKFWQWTNKLKSLARR